MLGKLVVQPTTELLPWADCRKARENGFLLAHCADLIRFYATFLYGGWWLDDDIMWYREPPQSILSKCGHREALGGAKTMQGYTKDEDHRHWQLHYLGKPGDRSGIMTPFCFPPKSRLCGSVLAWVEAESQLASVTQGQLASGL